MLRELCAWEAEGGNWNLKPPLDCAYVLSTTVQSKPRRFLEGARAGASNQTVAGLILEGSHWWAVASESFLWWVRSHYTRPSYYYCCRFKSQLEKWVVFVDIWMLSAGCGYHLGLVQWQPEGYIIALFMYRLYPQLFFHSPLSWPIFISYIPSCLCAGNTSLFCFPLIEILHIQSALQFDMGGKKPFGICSTPILFVCF